MDIKCRMFKLTGQEWQKRRKRQQGKRGSVAIILCLCIFRQSHVLTEEKRTKLCLLLASCTNNVSGPAVWNSLPAALRLDMSLSVFRRRLKTFFMTEAADCNS